MGLEQEYFDVNHLCFKKHRWLFRINNIIGKGVNALPPLQGGRPEVTFSPVEVNHLTEAVSFPGRPTWKPITITVYDLKNGASMHPIWEWVTQLYNPRNNSKWSFSSPQRNSVMKTAYLDMLDGCGKPLQTWVYEGAYPEVCDFGDVDMTSSDVMTCDITLRYHRAYLLER